MKKYTPPQTFALLWIALSLAVVIRAGYSDIQADQFPGFSLLITGIPALFVLILSIGLLCARTISMQKMLVLLLGFSSAVILLGAPILALLILVTTGLVFYASFWKK